ncbi:MAG: nicotinate-nucleotide diphosphorylase (carboxylating) [Bacteroidetes bacterium 43-93]|nr:carboxylating nicotinate-nucleotide diphosphorylase [Bacteroidota bacterium]OJW96379.1 MAG: nicotinate-nucleotide diphosphorylase (carboxylating) [Bacteroidetes bacterium 43-93]
MEQTEFIAAAFREDIQTGDHSTLATIPADANGKAILKVKERGIVAGVQLAQDIFHYLQPDAQFTLYKNDGDTIEPGDIVFEVAAKVHTILQAERLALNCMQRMSGIATLTNTYVNRIKGYNSKILDTRKTTPLFRAYEKLAVKIGGGHNYRMGLYDMIMLKDNHIDFCGGIEKAIQKTNKYLADKNLNLEIVIETRSIDDVKEVLRVGGVTRIMLDNFKPEQITEALALINGEFETEASGGITLDNIEAYAKTGVDYMSVGAIINHAVSLDLSLKAHIS